MEYYRCLYCDIEFAGNPSDKRFGSTFCTKKHYNSWRKDNASFDIQGRSRDYTAYMRAVWGGSGKKANEAGAWARKYGRKFEEIAERVILPSEGFTDIDNWSEQSNQFFIDFVATRDGERQFIDVTCKFSAYVPQKSKLAKSLGFTLYILHVSPADPTVYALNRLATGQVTSKVPMALFHEVYARQGREIPNAPNALCGPRVPRIERECKSCGKLIYVPERLKHRKKYCSRTCVGHAVKPNLVQHTKSAADQK